MQHPFAHTFLSPFSHFSGPRLSSQSPSQEVLTAAPLCPPGLALLDKAVPAEGDGGTTNEKTLARHLRRFGEPAKQELPNRAAGDHPGWRNLASAILWEWHSWNSADVPALRKALERQHGGWPAGPLAEIGTLEAIQALAGDLAQCEDIENQTGWALTRLGPKSIPSLFLLLANDQSARQAASPSAAHIAGRVVVFSPTNGILGLAACDPH